MSAADQTLAAPCFRGGCRSGSNGGAFVTTAVITPINPGGFPRRTSLATTTSAPEGLRESDRSLISEIAIVLIKLRGAASVPTPARGRAAPRAGSPRRGDR